MQDTILLSTFFSNFFQTFFKLFSNFFQTLFKFFCRAEVNWTSAFDFFLLLFTHAPLHFHSATATAPAKYSSANRTRLSFVLRGGTSRLAFVRKKRLPFRLERVFRLQRDGSAAARACCSRTPACLLHSVAVSLAVCSACAKSFISAKSSREKNRLLISSFTSVSVSFTNLRETHYTEANEIWREERRLDLQLLKRARTAKSETRSGRRERVSLHVFVLAVRTDDVGGARGAAVSRLELQGQDAQGPGGGALQAWRLGQRLGSQHSRRQKRDQDKPDVYKRAHKPLFCNLHADQTMSEAL